MNGPPLVRSAMHPDRFRLVTYSGTCQLPDLDHGRPLAGSRFVVGLCLVIEGESPPPFATAEARFTGRIHPPLNVFAEYEITAFISTNIKSLALTAEFIGYWSLPVSNMVIGPAGDWANPFAVDDDGPKDYYLSATTTGNV